MRADRVSEAAQRELTDAVAAVGMLRAGLAPADVYVAVGWGEPGADGVPPGAPVAAAVAARLAHRTGAPLAPVLEAMARASRARMEAAIVAEAALAGPRLSARILAWLPVVGLGMSVVVEPGVVRVLATPLGAAALALALGLTWAGRAWMRRLVARARVPPAPGVLVMEAMRAVLASGADVRTAVEAVGRALDGRAAGAPHERRSTRGGTSASAHRSPAPDGRALVDVAAALGAGSTWSDAWSAAPEWAKPLERALALPWAVGAQAAPLLAAAGDIEALRERRAAQVAAAELAVRLTLPLALCLLPAFVVAGIVPLIVSLVGGL